MAQLEEKHMRGPWAVALSFWLKLGTARDRGAVGRLVIAAGQGTPKGSGPEPFGVVAADGMDSKRLVVWISAGILVFQGTALAVDLFNCMTVTWLLLQRRGVAELEQPFCSRPQGRIDAAVAQGLSVLAGLALGSSAVGQGRDRL
jgi:hypothetical protein